MKYKNILFDLDGTLINTAAGISNAIMHAVNTLNLTIPSYQELKAIIGPALLESFKQLFGADEKQAHNILDLYREYYEKKGKYECEVYEGMEDVIKNLAEHGYNLFVATAKYDVPAKEILNYFKLDKYFERISGAVVAGIADKSEIIARSVAGYEGKCLMVGDTVYDIEGAKANKMDVVLAAYGFGNEESLKIYQPEYTIRSPKEILSILM